MRVSVLVVALVGWCVGVSALPLTSRSALNGVRAHGALNTRLTWEQVETDNVGEVQEQWMTQTLDHNNLASTATFQQRYYVNDTLFDRKVPRVFYMLGGEGPVSPSYVGDHFITADLSQRYSAMVVTLEHRFYGKSIPGNDSSTENLRYLSSDLALEDSVTFRAHITEQYKLPVNTQWIVFGGSYSGSLAAWARSKYPNLFQGSYATSAPVQAQLDFHQYFEVVTRSVGEACAANLKASTAAVVELLSSDRASLQQRFNVCSPITSDKDVANFVSSLTGPIAEIVQYNIDNRAGALYDIPTLCARLEAGATPLDGLTNVWFDQQKASQNEECTDMSYETMIAQMQPTSDARSWTYQTCNEFGYFQDVSPNVTSPFSTLISLKFYTDMCNDIFQGAPTPFLPNTAFINDFYGGKNIVATNTVFANGDIDPWHVLGNYQLYPASALSDTVLIHGTAHCADLYPPRASDLVGLTRARSIQNALLAQWLHTQPKETVAAPKPHARKHHRSHA